MDGWIGVDLDGTLAFYDEWRGEEHIGNPIPAMVDRVLHWIHEGKKVKIFTARVWNRTKEDIAYTRIEEWVKENIGIKLEITCCKDYGMIELWDDRAIRVELNTGRVI